MTRGSISPDVADNSQAIFGLGIDESDVVAGGAADETSFDPTGLDNTDADDVQEAVEDLDAAITAASAGGGFTPVGLAAAFNYTKDGARHASLLKFTPIASGVYVVRGYVMFTGLANGGEQATLEATFGAGATVIGVVHTTTATTFASIAWAGTAVGVTSGAAISKFEFVAVLTQGANTTDFVLALGDNSGAGTAVVAAGSYLEYLKVA